MIYIDELLLLNFIIDYVLVDFTSYVLKSNVVFYRKILACLFGEISVLYLFFNLSNIYLIIFKLILGMMMILICFGFKDIKTFISNTIYFYSFSFLLGGTLYYFKIENIFKYKFILLGIPLIMNVYKKLLKKLKSTFYLKYKVTIYLKSGKILYLNGYMDSGNNLIDPITKKKVIIINKKIKENYFLIPYQTINDEALLKCFKPKKVYIDKIGERNDILIGITNKKFVGFDCLLNHLLLEEK